MNNATLTKNDSQTNVQRESEKSFLSPSVNIITSEEGYTLEAEMPGVNKQGLEILLEAEELTIIGRRSVPKVEGQILYRESTQRDYRRTFVLDPVIDTARISARIDNGLLTLVLPKTEKVKPRKITVE